MPSIKMEDRSIHIDYKPANNERIRAGIISLVKLACEIDGATPSEFTILDAGCGRGEFLKEAVVVNGFKARGLDMDPRCVELSQKYSPCVCESMENASRVFGSEDFNLVLLSHALEHTANPVDIINEMKIVTKKWIILAVPNPIRPKILMKHALFSKDYSNKGHYYSWDRSHFHNLLTTYCGLEIVKWATDDIRVIPFKRLRSLFRAVRILDWLETKFLPRCFPYFSSSLIVLCKKRTEQ